MNKQYIFIDDSGDPGFNKSPTDHFIIAAVLLSTKDEKDLLNSAIGVYRKELGWNELEEFKFKTTNKKIILNFIDFVKVFDFSAYVMVLDKTKTHPNALPKDKSSTYYYVIKELLLKLNLTCPVITIDGNSTRHSVDKIKTYLRQNLRKNKVKNIQVRLVDSRKNSLVQLADIVAGSVARSYRADKTHAKTFIKAFDDKITKIYEITP